MSSSQESPIDPELQSKIDALRATVRNDPKFDSEENMAAPIPVEYQAAHEFLASIFGPDGYPPDVVGQLVEVFIPCLRIMVDHDWGELWRGAGLQSVMDQLKSKFDRYWERTWTKGERHADSGFDLINIAAFTLRQDPDNIWGNRGRPAWAGES